MKYTKTNWINGVTELTQENLNKIESGIEDASSRVSQLSNPNLLINGDFKIWQRGTVFTARDYNLKYGVDRWLLFGNLPDDTWMKDNNGLLMTRPTGGSGVIRITQYIENFKFFSNKELTLSLYGASNVSTLELFIFKNDTPTKIKNIELTSGSDYRSVTFNVGDLSSIAKFGIMLQGVGDYSLRYIKLELGTVATPFIPHNYSEELALCKRYFERLGNGNDEYVCFVTMVGTNSYEGGTYCEVTKRLKSPTVTFKDVSKFRIRHWGGAASVSTMRGASLDGRSIILAGTANVEGSIRSGHLQRQDNTELAYIDVDAEIY